MRPTSYHQKKRYTVLKKRHDIVSGEGIECVIIKHSKKMTMSFFGTAYTETETSYEKVTKEECHIMSATKQCRGKVMTCSNRSTCKYKPHIAADYRWFSTTTVTDYECHFTSRIVNAKKVNDTVFDSLCRVRDLFCRLEESIIVWNASVIHLCPFSKIIVMDFNYDSENSIVYNRTEPLLFQLKPIENHCDIDMIPTQEGFYLIEDRRSTAEKKSPIGRPWIEHFAFYSQSKLNYPLDSNDINDLTLANMDFDHYINLKHYASLKNQQCNNFVTQLNMISGLENVYTKVYVRDSGEIIVYSTGGNILIPKCLPVSNVRVPTQTKNCYEDLPVIFDLGGNITISGFMTSSIVLTKYSKKIDCVKSDLKKITMPWSINSDKKYYVIDNGHILVQNGNVISLDKTNKSMPILHRDKDIFNPNFHHSKYLTNGVDIITGGLAINPAFTELEEVDGNFLVAQNENSGTDHLLLAMGIKSYFSELKNIAKSIISYMLVTIFTIFVVYLFIKQRYNIMNLMRKLCNGFDYSGNLFPTRFCRETVKNKDIDENFL